MKQLLLMVFIALFSMTAYAQESNAPSWTREDGNVVNQEVQPQEPSKEPLKLFIPNAFSPNDDGINDEYFITTSYFSSANFSVFDRWGNEVFTAEDVNFRWNGKQDNTKVAAGVYVYVFKGMTKDGTEIRRSGTISVVY